jgi:hypothetical protein
MPRILGVHGIAQQYRSGPELTRVWMDALRGGLEAAGFRATADGLTETDVRVAFFGDLFRPHGAMAAGDPPYTPADLKPGPEQDLLGVWYEAAVVEDPSLAPPPGAMGAGRMAAQAMLYRLLRSRTFAGVAQRGLIGNLKQVTAFLTQPDVQEQVLRKVADEITPDTRVVVGHSLGSLVVYEFLSRFALPEVELLVTLGSPLGIPHLIFDRLVPAPVGGLGTWPGRVAQWVNIADEDDVVALCKQLAPLFPALHGGTGIVDHLVDNGDEPHAINRYLNAQATGRVLGMVL